MIWGMRPIYTYILQPPARIIHELEHAANSEPEPTSGDDGEINTVHVFVACGRDLKAMDMSGAVSVYVLLTVRVCSSRCQ